MFYSSWATASTIRSLENQWQTAIKNHDVDALDKLLSENLEATSFTGKEGSKNRAGSAMRRDKNVYKSARARGMTVTNKGPGTTVVIGTSIETGKTTEDVLLASRVHRYVEAVRRALGLRVESKAGRGCRLKRW